MHSREPYATDDIKRKRRRGAGDFPDRLLSIPEITAAAIISTDGLPIASALPQGVDETRIAAMTATLLSLSEKVIDEMNKGDFHEFYIKGSQGFLLILQAGSNAFLMVSTTQDAHLGSILLDCSRMCEKIARLI